MTPEEAIEIIETTKGLYKPKSVQDAFNMAVNAIREVQQYREIGTVKECREAREKQKSKKTKIYTDTRNGMDLHGRVSTEEVEVYLCPSCDSCVGYVGDSIMSHCENCGQAIGSK